MVLDGKSPNPNAKIHWNEFLRGKFPNATQTPNNFTVLAPLGGDQSVVKPSSPILMPTLMNLLGRGSQGLYVETKMATFL